MILRIPVPSSINCFHRQSFSTFVRIGTRVFVCHLPIATMDAPTTPSKNPKGASKLLADLPSKGLFSSAVVSSNLGGMRVYVTDHDTSPPENQLIKTDQMNILIRSLLLKQQQKGESSGKVAKEGSRKRASERAVDGRASTKRAASSSQPQPEGPKSRVPDDLQKCTVERIRFLLKERGLSQRGKKDELIARLRSATDGASSAS